MEEFDILKLKAKMLGDEDFSPVCADYGNELSLYAEDFPELMEEERGDEVMLVVRGAIKGEGGSPVVVGEKENKKLHLYIWDAALIHGKKSMRLGGGGKFEAMSRALMGKGFTKDRAEAITAAAGRKKYGKSKFQEMSAKGLRRYWRNK